MAVLSDEIVKLTEITSTYLQDVFQCWIDIQELKDIEGLTEKEVIEMLSPDDRDFIAHALRLLDIRLFGCTKEDLENLI
jgi:hypothetical protein